jgi:uncharacterized protein involved in high-affinity Fe2+ transport
MALRPCSLALFAAAFAFLAMHASATEMKLGKEGERVVHHNMTIEGEYIQPIVLEGGKENHPREKSDAYFIAHIKAAGSNPLGFSKFAWIPNLGVSYTLTKLDSNWVTRGSLTPAIAKFGPHYGANVKLDGVGKYRYSIHVSPPAEGIYRLVDIENGVLWWKPFEVSWDFTFLGLGKRGVIGATGGY